MIRDIEDTREVGTCHILTGVIVPARLPSHRMVGGSTNDETHLVQTASVSRLID